MFFNFMGNMVGYGGPVISIIDPDIEWSRFEPARDITLTVHLSTQLYEMGTSKFNAAITML